MIKLLERLRIKNKEFNCVKSIVEEEWYSEDQIKISLFPGSLKQKTRLLKKQVEM